MPYPATATAVVDSTVVAWTTQQTHALVERHPRMAANALRIVGGRAEAMLRRIEELSTEGVEQRLARALLRLARDAGRPVATGVQVDFTLSRQDLAELCGATLYTASRTLSAWAKEGIVETGRRRVVVRDLGRLTNIAEERARRP
jgi:CRP-like cAMP-binding protein